MYARILLILTIVTFAVLSPTTDSAIARQSGPLSADDRQGGDSMDDGDALEEEVRRLLRHNGLSPELLDNALGRGALEVPPPPGSLVVNHAWTDQQSDGDPIGAVVDIEGNIIVAQETASGLRVDKFDGADNTSPARVWPIPAATSFLDTVIDCAVDLDGNIYVAGAGGPGGNGQPRLVKIAPQGFIVWQREYVKPTGLNPLSVGSIHLSQDGVPFVVTSEDGVIYQIDPSTGAFGWQTILTAEEFPCLGEFDELFASELLVGQNGLVYVYGVTNTDSGFLQGFVACLDGGTGEMVWCERPEIPGGRIWNIDKVCFGSEQIAIDFNNDIYIVAGFRLNGPGDALLEKRNGETGELLLRKTYAPAIAGQYGILNFNDIELPRDGSIVVGGYASSGTDIDKAFTARLDTQGDVLWQRLSGDEINGSPLFMKPEGVCDVELDDIGNVYVLIQTVSDFDENLRIVRYKLDDQGGSVGGTEQWNQLDAPVAQNVDAINLVVDRGSNVFSIGRTIGSGVRLSKYTQPVLLAPTRQSASAELKLENRSIWAPTVGSLQEDADLFTFGPTESIPPFGPVWPLNFQIGGIVDTIFFGEWGAQVTFDFSGVLNMGVRAEVDGGTADVHLPFDIEWKIPNPESLEITGQPVIIESDWTPDPGARLTSCFTPRVNAGVTAGGSFGALINVRAEAASFEVFNENLLDIPTQTFQTDYIPGFNLSDLLTTFGSGTSDDVKITIADSRGLLTGTFSVPSLRAKSGYDATNERFMTNVDVLEEDSRFLSIRASITQAVLTSFGASAIFSYDLPRNASDDEDFKLSAFAGLLQLSSGLDLGLGQQIGVETIPKIRYTFPGTGIDDIVLEAGEDLVFPLPASKSFDIVPFIDTPTSFSNRTTVAAIPGISFEALRLGLSASAFGFDVVSGFGLCLGCYNWDVSEILDALGLPGDLINVEIPVFDSSWDTVKFPVIQLPCIRVVGDLTQTPRLLAASRGAVDMIIYDQTSPSVSSFNVATDGKTRMLLYGEEFMNSALSVKVEHNGRIETLTEGFGLRHINDFTLLVELPNILRLTPGIAKIWIENSFGNSETIDLCIEYPTPRLDAVNPNLWAADPTLATVPVSVIDAKSFIGNDTYIARRDYWIKLRDDLWSSFTAGGLTAQEYFPLFDFDQLPGFPAVLWKKGLSSFVGTTFPPGANAYIAARPDSVHDRFGFLTLEAWVRPDLGPSGFHQILTTSPDGIGGYRWGIRPNGALRFTTWAIADYDTPAGLVPDGVWSHVAVVFTSGKCEFYLNGELVSTVNQSLNSFDNPNAQVMIGGTPTGDRYVGDLAEVRFWNTPRSAQQIHDNLARPLYGSEGNLIGYWPLNALVDFGAYNGGNPGANGIDDRSPTNAIGEAFNIADQHPRVLFPPSLPIAPFPLPRFIQPVDNGIHNVRLTVDLYESPQNVRVALCNPGPGGGMSNEVNLTIAAPTPVVSGMEPANISPLDIVLDPETLEPQPMLLTIVGPKNVPTFEGFEEPKFGNFNRDSVVYYNGEALETQYNGSANLTAILSPELITEGDHFVNVLTPSNGTQYFEQRFRDVDGDGEPDDEDPMTFGLQPFEQMLVDSGGVSNPVFFRVRYRDPVIENLFPSRAEQDLAAFDAGQMLVVTTDAPGAVPMVALPYNMTITGSDFRPGADVYFGDELRNSEVVDSTCIRVELLPEDVDAVGTFPITVLNPGNPPIPSAAAFFEVTPIARSAASSRYQDLSKPRPQKPTR